MKTAPFSKVVETTIKKLVNDAKTGVSELEYDDGSTVVDEARAAIIAAHEARIKSALAKHVLAGMPELTVRQQEYITKVLAQL